MKKREIDILSDLNDYCLLEKTRIARTFWSKVLTIAILIFLLGFILIEPFGRSFLDSFLLFNEVVYALSFLVFYWVKGALFLEVLGYLLHRFTEHPSFVTRISHHYRQNQQYHWIHHMVMYPFGDRYYERKKENYIDVVREGLPLYFLIPLSVSALMVLLVMGFTIESLIFILASLFQAKLNDLTHSRFHLLKHPWKSSHYFQWLADIHLLHHWDQEKNFTIMNPFLDMVFGTYLSPKKRLKVVKKYLSDSELNASELISWNYLLAEAKPVKRAVFISGIRKHPELLEQARKIDQFLNKILKTSALPKTDFLVKNFLSELSKRMKMFLNEC
jgi:hypothetical protein